MAYQEAIERSARVLIGHLKKRADSGISRREYLKDCVYTAGIFMTQAEHLGAVSEALEKQALDLYRDITRSLNKWQKR